MVHEMLSIARSGLSIPLADSAGTDLLPMIYLVSVIVGGGMILISTVLGGSHDGVDGAFDVSGADGLEVGGADVSVDAAHPVNVAHSGGTHHHAGAGIGAWFSVRFVFFFLAVFGAVGTILSHASTLAGPSILLASALAGLAVGQLAHQAIRMVARTGSDSSPKSREYVSQPARVTVSVIPPNLGEIAVFMRDAERFVACRARNDHDRFAVGDPVVIVAYANGLAEVVSRKEYEFLNSRDS